MKREAALAFSLASLCLALMIPNNCHAQDNGVAPPSQPAANDQAGRSESMQMVPAQVALRESLDAGTAKTGDRIVAVLGNKIHLKNGKELPAGTQILGVVATDDMQTNGASKLALNFNQAKLKDGTLIPIKATIEGVFPAQDSIDPAKSIDDVAPSWSDRPAQVDQADVLPGVDLHSKIESQNSGVLVSVKKHELKLKYGTLIALAVAAAPQTSAGD